MTDLTDATVDSPSVAPEAPATGAAPASKIIKFTLKNGAGEMEVDVNTIPDAHWDEVISEGLKAVAERNMSKITKAAYPDDEERKLAIKAKAEENVKALVAGTLKLKGQKASKVAGKVMTEALRLAKAMIKDALRKAGKKQSSLTAKELTAAAKTLVESNKSIVATAEANLKAREETPTLDLQSLLKVDVTKLAAVTPPKPPLSKAKAGQTEKVAGRSKGSKGKAPVTLAGQAPQGQATPTA